MSGLTRARFISPPRTHTRQSQCSTLFFSVQTTSVSTYCLMLCHSSKYYVPPFLFSPYFVPALHSAGANVKPNSSTMNNAVTKIAKCTSADMGTGACPIGIVSYKVATQRLPGCCSWLAASTVMWAIFKEKLKAVHAHFVINVEGSSRDEQLGPRRRLPVAGRSLCNVFNAGLVFGCSIGCCRLFPCGIGHGCGDAETWHDSNLRCWL